MTLYLVIALLSLIKYITKNQIKHTIETKVHRKVQPIDTLEGCAQVFEIGLAVKKKVGDVFICIG